MAFTDRQIEIIKAATELIGDRGIQNLTTKNLAAEMGFSEPALYRHFKGKTEILVSVLSFYRAILKNEMSKIINGDLSGLDKLGQIMKFQFNHFNNNPAIVMVIFSETSFQYEKVLSEAVLKIMSQKKKMIEDVVKLGQKDGSIRKDCEENHLASIFMGSMRFTVLKWRLNDYRFDLINEGNSLWNTVNKLMTTQA
jgi:TetR/AcrR family fatty acid metabolism transcriptional regulator